MPSSISVNISFDSDNGTVFVIRVSRSISFSFNNSIACPNSL